MTKRILAYISFGLGLLTILFFRNYNGTIIPYPTLIYFIGLAFFLIGLFLLRRTPTIKDQKTIEQLKKRIADLKETAEKIKIDFSKCEIKENNYTEEKERYGTGNEFTTLSVESEIQAWNALTDETRNTKLVTVNQTVLIYRQNHNGKTETFYSRIIPRERISLLFKLDAQKTTTLYVDRRDRTNYYFDLDFLDN